MLACHFAFVVITARPALRPAKFEILIQDFLAFFLNFVYGNTINSLLTDTSIRRTPGGGPGRFLVILLQPNSLKDGHLLKTDNGHFEIVNGHL